MKRFFKSTTPFFILAFTFAIFTFSLAASILESKRTLDKKFNPNNTKNITFQLESDIDIDKIVSILEKDPITLTLSSFITADTNKEWQGYDLTTKLIMNSFDPHSDVIKGKILSPDDYINGDNIGVTTKSLENNSPITLTYGVNKNQTLSISPIGQISSYTKVIIIPQKTFFNYIGNKSLLMNNFSIILSGEPNALEESIKKINNYITTLSPNNKIIVYSPSIDSPVESTYLIFIALIIIAITILNSICISYLWVEDNKKDLVLRKVCGAKSKMLFYIFFKELFITSIVSFLIALSLHLLLSFITNGIIFGLYISPTLLSIIYTFIVTIITSYITAIPVFKYVLNLQPTEILRED